MGTPIDPPPSYGINCNTCFPVGETPDTVYASVVGVKVGDLHDGSQSDPPNGIFELHQIFACEWETDDFPGVLWKPAIFGASNLTITVADPGLAFTDTPVNNCIQRFVADWQSPVARFHYGGVVQIMTLADLTPISIQTIATLAGVTIATDTMMDFWPAGPSDEVVVSFARIQDTVRILIKQDLTP